MRSRGVARIVCGTVNDHHVVRPGRAFEALGKIGFIADVNALFAEALGLTRQTSDLGKRFVRFAMIIDDGVVQDVFVQDVGVTVSGAPAILWRSGVRSHHCLGSLDASGRERARGAIWAPFRWVFALAISACSMGNMFGGGSSNSQLQNASASQ
jgi:hypothetical protein